MRVTPKRVHPEAEVAAAAGVASSPAAASASQTAAAASSSSDSAPASAKRSKRNGSRPHAVANAPAAAANGAAGSARAAAAGSGFPAPASPIATLLASAELHALLTGTKPVDQKFVEVEAKLTAELQRAERGEPRLLDFDFADSERPASGGTLLTTLLRQLVTVAQDAGCDATRKALRLIDDSLLGTLAAVLKDARFNARAVDEGWSPLQLVCEIGLPWQDCALCDLIEALLKHGADINALGPKGPALLQWAIGVNSRTGNSSVFSVLFLLDHGANINAQDSDGDALLHVYAAIQPSVENFKALVASPHFAKADLTLRSGDGQTPLQVARTKLAELRDDPAASSEDIERQNFIVRVLAPLTLNGALAVAAPAAAASAEAAGDHPAPAAAAQAAPSAPSAAVLAASAATVAPSSMDAPVLQPMKTEN